MSINWSFSNQSSILAQYILKNTQAKPVT